jgi:hypothetical protein
MRADIVLHEPIYIKFLLLVLGCSVSFSRPMSIIGDEDKQWIDWKKWTPSYLHISNACIPVNWLAVVRRAEIRFFESVVEHCAASQSHIGSSKYESGVLSAGLEVTQASRSLRLPSNGNIEKTWRFVRFEVLTAVTMESAVIWDVIACSLIGVYRNFGGVNPQSRKHNACWLHACLQDLGLIFNSEDGGSTFSETSAKFYCSAQRHIQEVWRFTCMSQTRCNNTILTTVLGLLLLVFPNNFFFSFQAPGGERASVNGRVFKYILQSERAVGHFSST